MSDANHKIDDSQDNPQQQQQRVKQLTIEIEAFCASKRVKIDWSQLVDPQPNLAQVYGVFVAVHTLSRILTDFRIYSPLILVCILDSFVSGHVLRAISVLKANFAVNLDRYVLVDTRGGEDAFGLQRNLPTEVSEQAVFWYTDRPASKPAWLSKDENRNDYFVLDLIGECTLLKGAKRRLTRSEIDSLLHTRPTRDVLVGL